MSDTLEAAYRRVLMLLPRQYWADHAEEMLGVLMDGAKPGQRGPKAREVLSVAMLAMRLRVAAGDPKGSGRLAGDILRRAVPAYLIFWFGLLAQWQAYGDRSGYFFIVVVVHAGIIASLLLGWPLIGRALYIAYGGYLFRHEQLWSNWEHYSFGVQVQILIPFLALAAAVLVFHRRAPRLPGTTRWLLIWAGITVAFWLRGESIRHRYALDISDTAALTALVWVAAAIFALRHAKASPAWPTALALAGLPMLTSIQVSYLAPEILTQVTWNGLYVGLVIGAEILLLCTALASFLFLAHRRRLLSTGGEAAQH